METGNPKLDSIAAQVRDALKDPSFKSEFEADPIAACRQRFGQDVLLGQREYVRRNSDGSFILSVPGAGVLFDYKPGMEIAEENELPDELLDLVSAGSPAVQCKDDSVDAFNAIPQPHGC
jgi:hypothetical protein